MRSASHLRADVARLPDSIHIDRDSGADATCFTATVPAYVGGCMAFGWATDDMGLRAISSEDLGRRYAAANLKTRYYSPTVHQAAFALPGYIVEILG